MIYIRILITMNIAFWTATVCAQTKKLTELEIKHSLNDGSRARDGRERNIYLVDMTAIETTVAKPELNTKQDRHGSSDAQKTYKKFRLYLRYEPSLEKWVFDVTDGNGQFSSPRTQLVEGSTIPGLWAGGSPDNWYLVQGSLSTFPDKSKLTEVLREMVKPGSGKTGQYFLQEIESPQNEVMYSHSRIKNGRF
jgi:hypothetical protein